MFHEDFEKVIDDQVKHIWSSMAAKNAEYATDEDKLYNFKRTAEIKRCTPESALWGMLLKHYVSVQDIVEAVERGEQPPKMSIIAEKIGDLINYLILLKALLIERHMLLGSWDSVAEDYAHHLICVLKNIRDYTAPVEDAIAETVHQMAQKGLDSVHVVD